MAAPAHVNDKHLSTVLLGGRLGHQLCSTCRCRKGEASHSHTSHCLSRQAGSVGKRQCPMQAAAPGREVMQTSPGSRGAWFMAEKLGGALCTSKEGRAEQGS